MFVLDFHRLVKVKVRIFDIVFFFGVCKKGVFNGEMWFCVKNYPCGNSWTGWELVSPTFGTFDTPKKSTSPIDFLKWERLERSLVRKRNIILLMEEIQHGYSRPYMWDFIISSYSLNSFIRGESSLMIKKLFGLIPSLKGFPPHPPPPPKKMTKTGPQNSAINPARPSRCNCWGLQDCSNLA